MMNKNMIVLPHIQAEFSYPLPDKELLLAGGGRPPAPEWLCAAASGRRLWCIDHGIDCCCRAGLLPQRLIGDGDSASQEAWHWAMLHNVEIAKFPPEKDYTDTQLTLEMAAGENSFVILTAALGGRFDHAYSTIFSFGSSGLKGCIADDREAVFFLHTEESVRLALSKKPKAISLLPVSAEVTGVNISGVHWELEDVVLTQSCPYAVSNEAEENVLSVSVGMGILAVYICWQE